MLQLNSVHFFLEILTQHVIQEMLWDLCINSGSLIGELVVILEVTAPLIRRRGHWLMGVIDSWLPTALACSWTHTESDIQCFCLYNKKKDSSTVAVVKELIRPTKTLSRNIKCKFIWLWLCLSVMFSTNINIRLGFICMILSHSYLANKISFYTLGDSKITVNKCLHI